jgi:hypothetical protein
VRRKQSPTADPEPSSDLVQRLARHILAHRFGKKPIPAVLLADFEAAGGMNALPAQCMERSYLERGGLSSVAS